MNVLVLRIQTFRVFLSSMAVLITVNNVGKCLINVSYMTGRKPVLLQGT